MSALPTASSGADSSAVQIVEELYECAPCGFVVSSLDGPISWVNETFLDWTGYSRKEIVGTRRFTDLLTPGGRLYHGTEFAPLLHMQGSAKSLVLDLVRADGGVLPVLLHSLVRDAHDGTPPKIFSSIFDATERRRYEQELLHTRREAERSERRERILHRIGAETSAAEGGSGPLAQTLAGVLKEVFTAAGAAIWLFDAPRTVLSRTAAVGLPAGVPVTIESDSPLPPAQACRTGDLVCSRVPAAAYGTAPAGAEPAPGRVDAGPDEWVAVPVTAAGRTLGAYTLHFRRGRDLDQGEVRLLHTVAAHAGQVLTRADSQRQIHSILEGFADGVVAVDADWRLTYANARAAELAGIDPEGLAGHSLWQTLTSLTDAFRPLLQEAMAGTSPAPVAVWPAPGEVCLELRAFPSPAGGATLCLSDITARERLAAARRDRDERKDAFLRTVAHDLRNPLSVIAGMASILQEDQDGHLGLDAQERRDLAGRIAANAMRLNGLVTDLLDLDRFSRGALTARRVFTDVGALVSEVAARMEVEDRLLHVQTDTVQAAVDPTQVERIVENLITNAARRTPAGTSIWVHAADTGDWVLIAVDDAGPGVPEERKAGIFQLYQHDAGAGGTGIALSVVAGFAELHGGRAWVQDRPGGGASFRVQLARRTS